MTYSYLITLFFTLSFVSDGSPRYKNKVQLLPLLLRSKYKFVIHLFMKHLKKDIFSIITAIVFIVFSDNSNQLKTSLLILFILIQFFVRTFEYFNLKDSIWILCAPLILSSFLLDQTLTLILSLFTYITLILSIHSALSYPLKSSKTIQKMALKPIPLIASTLFLCLIFTLSPLASKLSLGQIIPLVSLLIVFRIESIVTSNKEVIQRFQAYFSIYRIRVAKLSMNLLGPQVRQTLQNSSTVYLTLIIVYALTTKQFDSAIVLILLNLYSILATLDLMSYHYITDISIVYDNKVTRFLITQTPGMLIFSYVMLVSIDKYLESNVTSYSMNYINNGVIVLLFVLILIYLRRLFKIVAICS